MPLIVCQTMQCHHSTMTTRIKRLYFDTLIVTVEIHHYCKKTNHLFYNKTILEEETEDPLYQCMCPSENENVSILMLFPMLISDYTLFLACKNTLFIEITRHPCELSS